MGDLTDNFSTNEFACPCCGVAKMDEGFMQRLQLVREELGVAFRPVEGGGYRCQQYLRGSKSAHGEGKAIDVNLGREHYWKFIELCMKHGFVGIGVKNKSGRHQLHADTAAEIRGVRPRPWLWTY